MMFPKPPPKEKKPYRWKRKPKATRHVIPAASRDAVYYRSGGRCEAPIHAEGCRRRGEHVHHRRLLSQGGSDHPNNLAHLSLVCHGYYHSHPTEAMELGIIVSGYVQVVEVAS